MVSRLFAIVLDCLRQACQKLFEVTILFTRVVEKEKKQLMQISRENDCFNVQIQWKREDTECQTVWNNNFDLISEPLKIYFQL